MAKPPRDDSGVALSQAGRRPAAILRGTARGLELVVWGGATADAIVEAVEKRLDEAPAFFRGSDVRVRVEEGPLAPGCIARLDELAVRFELRIVELTAVKAPRTAADDAGAVPQVNLATGSAPSPAGPTAAFEDEAPTQSVEAAAIPAATAALHDAPPSLEEPVIELVAEMPPEGAASEPADAGEISFEEPTGTAVPISLAATPEIELETVSGGTRLVVGPVRSGVILEHHGHVVVFGDVNPGAEVRAEGNIVVLGRLRGTAHAGIGQDVGFILALRLQPQQLRIGRMVARAADSDTPASDAELAYANGDRIVVERYLGKLPRHLATSL